MWIRSLPSLFSSRADCTAAGSAVDGPAAAAGALDGSTSAARLSRFAKCFLAAECLRSSSACCSPSAAGAPSTSSAASGVAIGLLRRGSLGGPIVGSSSIGDARRVHGRVQGGRTRGGTATHALWMVSTRDCTAPAVDPAVFDRLITNRRNLSQR
eukprot:6676704-Prymnesium_polylepis.1